MSAVLRRPQPHAGPVASPEALLPAPLFAIATADAPMGDDVLHPSEFDLVRNAVPQRRGEFAAGRHCARSALRRLGVGPLPILRQPSGCPLWPRGIVGSISHTRGLVLAVAAPADRVASVGVDVEWRERPFPQGTLKHICTRSELAWLRSLPLAQLDLHAYALFSAKEAVYKCVHAASGSEPGFGDVRISLDLPAGIFCAELALAAGLPAAASGRIGCTQRHVFSAMWLPRRPVCPAFADEAMPSPANMANGGLRDGM